jgi:Secreted repeat of unknown function
MKAGPAPGSREAQQPAVAVDHLASGHDPEPTVASADHGSTSSCYGACSSAHGGWPPLLTRGAPRVAGLNASLLGTTKRKDGSLQVTYAGHPLYYWSGDTAHSISASTCSCTAAAGTWSTQAGSRTPPRASTRWRRCPGSRVTCCLGEVHRTAGDALGARVEARARHSSDPERVVSAPDSFRRPLARLAWPRTAVGDRRATASHR